MQQPSTLYVGMEVHKDAIAVAYVAQDHGAEVLSLGLGHVSVTSIHASARGHRRPNIWSLSLKPDPVATGSPAL